MIKNEAQNITGKCEMFAKLPPMVLSDQEL